MCDTIDFSALFDDVSFADIVVHYGPHVDRRFIRLHKAIVCAQSPYLKQGCEWVLDQYENGWAMRWVQFTINPRFPMEAVYEVFNSLYWTGAQISEVIQRNDWALLVHKYEIAQLLGLEGQLGWIREAIAVKVQELEKTKHKDYPFAKNIIENTPFLKDEFRATLQNLNTEQMMSMLGSFSIAE